MMPPQEDEEKYQPIDEAEEDDLLNDADDLDDDFEIEEQDGDILDTDDDE